MNKIRRLPTRHSNTRRTGASRSGGMLILVLVILGVGMILITSALSVTIATRNRFYDDAQRSQAKLTVTSAAKTVVDAITVTQELRDAKIEAWAAAGETIYIRSALNYNFDVGVGSPNTVAPAIGANTTASNAYTAVTFSNPGGKITMDFVTKIDAGIDGGATERLRVVFKTKPPANSKGFSGLINAGDDDSNSVLDNAVMGAGGAGKSTNIIFLHGNYLAGMGGNKSTAAVVYTGIVSCNAGFEYHNDVVFMGDKAGLDRDGIAKDPAPAGQGIAVVSGGSLIYLGRSAGSVFWDYNGSVFVKSSMESELGGGINSTTSTICYNTNFTSTPNPKIPNNGFYNSMGKVFVISDETNNSTYNHAVNNGPVVDLGSDNTVIVGTPGTATATEISAMNAKLSKYNTPDMWAASEYRVPSTTEALNTYKDQYKPTTATPISASQLSQVKNLTAGNYSITPTTSTPLTGRWTFDLSSGPIYLIIKSNLTITTGHFRFINGSSGNFGYIFLEDGVKLTFGRYDGYANGGSGIVSEDDGYMVWANSEDSPKPPTKPHIYVIGFNNNEIDMTLEDEDTKNDPYQGSYLEGYYGMYGNNGRVEIAKVNVYGRVEASHVEMTPSKAFIPYCPAPWEDGDDGDTPIATKYEVDYYEYY